MIAVCVSEKKGEVKKPVPFVRVRCRHGIEGDAHAGDWHRQISLLADESVDTMRAMGVKLEAGAFAENILTRGIELKSLPVGTRLRVGPALLEVTQIGKECHSDCEIRRRTGDCIMPREGVFAEVLEGGEIRPGDAVTAQLPDPDRPFRAAVITLSDKGARGERKDESGPAAAEMLKDAG